MKTKQEQIEEMAEMCCDIREDPNCKECVVSPLCGTKMDCTTLYKAGYRKANDVIDELVEKVLGKIRYEYENYPDAMTVGTYHQLRKEINELADKMRQEVEK